MAEKIFDYTVTAEDLETSVRAIVVDLYMSEAEVERLRRFFGNFAGQPYRALIVYDFGEDGRRGADGSELARAGDSDA